MSLPKVYGPVVKRAPSANGEPRFVVTRYLANASGGYDVQALSVTGEWVDRPEGFEFDAEVLLAGG